MNVLITETEGFSPTAIETLKAAGMAVHLFSGRPTDLAGVIDEYDGVIVRFGVTWGEELIAGAKKLKFIATQSTGTNHIDLEAAARRGVEVVSLNGLPGMETVVSTAEHSFALLLCLMRKIIPAQESVFSGRWNRLPFVGAELSGKVVGVLGLGRLGSKFAVMATAFGARIFYFDPKVTEEKYGRVESPAQLAAISDVLSVHAPLSEETKNLLDEEFFNSCKKGMYFVNTSRGEIVDEKALIIALKSGQLAGAALDVLCGEPATGMKISSQLIEYARRNFNVIITPHIGGATGEAMRKTEEILAAEVARRFGN